MSGICGFVTCQPASPPEVTAARRNSLERMLAAIDYRGDATDIAIDSHAGLGYRWWSGRPGKSPAIHRAGNQSIACAGSLAPAVASPAAELMVRIEQGLATLDGAFAGAWWDGDRRRMTLLRDPFGNRSLYYLEHDSVFYFASELKQLLTIPGLPVELDATAVHKYLTFSFVPGEAVPIRGIKRLLPGRIAVWEDGELRIEPYFTLRERIDPRFEDRRTAVRLIRRRCQEAVSKRLNGEAEVGLFLSGGIDSAGVAYWLKEAGAQVRAFTLDFGDIHSERSNAQQVADLLQIPLELVRVQGADLLPVLRDLVWKLDLPFGDPVTGPQYLLGRAARQAGLAAVFNGEGGDQLFGGWTSKPMISAQLYANLYGDESREEIYLRSYHRFYGLENQLYTPDFRAQVGGPGQRRAILQPFLESGDATTFLNRVRLADISLKGSQNILPRMERMANGWALDARTPLFDRTLANASFKLPPQMKLHGACEKYILKLILQRHLPKNIVWGRKYGMSVPITDWLLGPLAPLVNQLFSPTALQQRDLFRDEYVSRLRQGENEPSETRRRRVGERLWTLMMLEMWLQIFVDGRGRRPETLDSKELR